MQEVIPMQSEITCDSPQYQLIPGISPGIVG